MNPGWQAGEEPAAARQTLLHRRTPYGSFLRTEGFICFRMMSKTKSTSSVIQLEARINGQKSSCEQAHEMTRSKIFSINQLMLHQNHQNLVPFPFVSFRFHVSFLEFVHVFSFLGRHQGRHPRHLAKENETTHGGLVEPVVFQATNGRFGRHRAWPRWSVGASRWQSSGKKWSMLRPQVLRAIAH